MDVQIRFARIDDLNALLPLVREFYAYEKLELREPRYRELMEWLIGNETSAPYGHVLVVDDGRSLLGYAVVTSGFSFEFDGLTGLIDELYIRDAFRGQGLGGQVLSSVQELCLSCGIKAIHLEADHFNVRVHEYYKRMGFKDHDRYLMTKWLRPPRS